MFPRERTRIPPSLSLFLSLSARTISAKKRFRISSGGESSAGRGVTRSSSPFPSFQPWNVPILSEQLLSSPWPADSTHVYALSAPGALAIRSPRSEILSGSPTIIFDARNRVSTNRYTPCNLDQGNRLYRSRITHPRRPFEPFRHNEEGGERKWKARFS